MPSLRHRVTNTASATRSWSRLAGQGLRSVAFLAYWLAVVLPLAYLVVLPASAFDLVDLTSLFGLALVHALAVVGGHFHDPRF